jgi:hypothetical protein
MLIPHLDHKNAVRRTPKTMVMKWASAVQPDLEASKAELAGKHNRRTPGRTRPVVIFYLENSMGVLYSLP